MKTAIRKLFCIFLCAVLAMGVFAVAAGAQQSGSLTETASWRFENGTLTVSGTGKIPENAIQNAISAFAGDITAVTVENGVTALGGRAFYCCTNLVSVSLPTSLKTISGGAFEYCDKLTKVTVPAGVQVIEGSAFMGCISLADVTLPASLHSIGDAAFRDCAALKEISLPAALSYIGAWAFMASGLQSIVLPAGVRVLGGWAFSRCHDLTYAILSGGIHTLPDCVFQNSALEFVVLPKSLQYVRDYAFYNCTLKEIYYEGTKADFEAIRLWGANPETDVPGTANKLFQTAEVITADVKTDAKENLGDMDGKDGVTAADARTVLRTAVKLETVKNGSADFYRADVNADAVITSADARLALRAAVKLEDLSGLQPYEPARVSDETLAALETFDGSLYDLLAQYDVELLFGEQGSATAVFLGETESRVMRFQSPNGLYFNKLFTPTVDRAAMNTLLRGASMDDVKAIDPGTAFGVNNGLGGPVVGASISCTTEGRVYLFTYDKTVISDIYVY